MNLHGRDPAPDTQPAILRSAQLLPAPACRAPASSGEGDLEKYSLM